MKNTFLTLLTLIMTIASNAQSKNFIDKPYLETTATADTLVVPDKIYLSITINEQDTKGKKSVEEMANKMKIELQKIGIDINEQLFLADAASNFKSYFLKVKQVLKNKSYTLLVYDALTAGKAIIALEEQDISNIRLIKTEFSKLETLEIALKQKAVLKAKKQAYAITSSLGQTLGKAIYINDIQGGIYYNQRSKTALGYTSINELEQDEEPLNIQFEKMKFTSTISVNFEIN